jgi:ABC-type antimicrobial peptide transport system permease subunit
VMSVILVLSIGEAAQRHIMDQISAFGSDMLYIRNGPVQTTGQPQLFPKESLTFADTKKLKSMPWVTVVAGKISQDDVISALGITKSAQVVGTTEDELKLSTTPIASGSFITTSHIDDHARVAVIGAGIAKDLFGGNDPLGQYVKANKVAFRVIGVMASAGSSGFLNPDKEIFVPVTSVLDLYNKKYLTYIQIKTTIANLETAKARIQAVMRDRHNIDNPGGDTTKDDFNIVTQEDMVKTASSVTGIMQILLTSIAAISLLVGGIGIMNIMYVSVTERIREIGLRKSIGARRSDIMRQFLVEAVIQTVLGGIIGIALGVFFSWIGIVVISQFQSGWTFAVSFNGVFLGLSVSAAIGIVFGYFPARSASKLSPIEALRRE